MGGVAPILLVEDNPDDVLLIERAFRKAKIAYPVEVISDGEAALAYLEGNDQYADRVRYPLPAVMLLDLRLPRLSGHEVLAWLRKQPGLRRLPVVILTSSREPSDLRQAYDGGVNSYLDKPTSPDALLSLVQTFSSYWLTFNEAPSLLGGRQ